ncbi:hypothetical protein QBC39DRAFT_121053 [Podospora conica]|nr:hypothetical protein QBC39DRAFT_121053 [Schizothecium conicum]
MADEPQDQRRTLFMLYSQRLQCLSPVLQCPILPWCSRCLYPGNACLFVLSLLETASRLPSSLETPCARFTAEQRRDTDSRVPPSHHSGTSLRRPPPVSARLDTQTPRHPDYRETVESGQAAPPRRPPNSAACHVRPIAPRLGSRCSCIADAAADADADADADGLYSPPTANGLSLPPGQHAPGSGFTLSGRSGTDNHFDPSRSPLPSPHHHTLDS